MDHSTKTVLYFTKSGNTTQQPEPGGPGTPVLSTSRLAQLVERKTLNLVVVGSSPTVGARHVFYLAVLLFWRSVWRATLP